MPNINNWWLDRFKVVADKELFYYLDQISKIKLLK